MMKKLLLFALIAVAREATAEDAKCVREHAGMIETIRAYARSEAGLLGPQGRRGLTNRARSSRWRVDRGTGQRNPSPM